MASRTAIMLLALLAVPAVLAETSIVQQLASSQFTGFLKLLEHVDLVPEVEAALASGKSLSLFCPTDDALLYHTSPTLLAFLKLQENKATLRKVLLSHIIIGRPSPFQWDGVHVTLEGSPLKLSMDSQAFYAADVAVLQYNALVVGDAAVHSLPTLIVPSSLSSNTKTFVEATSEVRRVLAAAPAPAGPSLPGDQPPVTVPGTPSSDNAAPRTFVSLVTVAAAMAAAFAF